MRKRLEVMGPTIWCAAALVAVALCAYRSMHRHELEDPQALWLLLLLPLACLHYVVRHRKRNASVTLSTLNYFDQAPTDVIAHLRHLPFALSIVGLGCLLLALARPQSQNQWQDVTREGIDIVLAMDISASMLAQDLKPDRLTASKEVALQFIGERPNDRIGLVVYEGEAYTQCPLTTDHHVLRDLFAQTKSGLIQSGTAVGSGLATAVNRLRESEAKSKVVILLTDGVSNSGTIQPQDAALIAEQMGVRVYTIGVGTRGKALSPVAIYPNGQYKYEYVPVEIDEPGLMAIAETTGGKYFRATDERKLWEIYNEIDKLEKTRVRVTEHHRRMDEYISLLTYGGALLLAGFVLDRTILRHVV
jgi:Ca-activated chloride channel homolog